MPDRIVVQHSHLAVQAVLSHILARDPPFSRQIRSIARVKERVIAGIGEERLKRKRGDGEDAREERQENQNGRDNISAAFA